MYVYKNKKKKCIFLHIQKKIYLKCVRQTYFLNHEEVNNFGVQFNYIITFRKP